MRLVLVISSLSCGGSERVLSEMANYWANSGHNITLITLDNGKHPFYKLNQKIKHVPLGLMKNASSLLQAIFSNFTRLKNLRQAIQESNPDAVISFIYTTNVMVLLSTILCSFSIIISERNHPQMNREKRPAWALLRRLVYPFANHLVVQTNSIKNLFRGFNKSIQVIANPVSSTVKNAEAVPEISMPNGNVIVAMGSLTYQKGFDLLIKVFENLHKRHPKWKLIIIGEGHLRADLQKLANESGAVNKIRLPGIVVNPASILKRADIFVLSSRYEGFPNALLEAMACGLPVVSFDCPSGPSDMILHDVNGLLVSPEDLDSLGQSLENLMLDDTKRRRLGEKALEVRKVFSQDLIMKKWEDLLIIQ